MNTEKMIADLRAFIAKHPEVRAMHEDAVRVILQNPKYAMLDPYTQSLVTDAVRLTVCMMYAVQIKREEVVR